MKAATYHSSNHTHQPAAVSGGKAAQRYKDRRPESAAVSATVQMMQGKPVVQRYMELHSGNYGMQPDNNQEQALFTHQTPKPELTDVGDHVMLFPRYGFHAKNMDNLPNLLVSGDRTVAIQQEAEPKEFYAVDEMRHYANAVLEAKKSKYRLRGRGHRMDLGKPETLEMIAPEFADQQMQEYQGLFGDFLTSVCRTMAERVMGSEGSRNEIIMQQALKKGHANPNAPMHRRKIDTGDGQRSRKLHNLAGALPFDTAYRALDTAFQEDDPHINDTQKGIAYGTGLRLNTLRENTQTLGLNEFAEPEIGEAYATYNTPAGMNDHGEALDYSVQANPLPRALTWGYHFAGVVATSMNGEDKITLENYNRDEDITTKLHTVYLNLVQEYGQVIEEGLKFVKNSESLPLRSRLKEAYMAVHAFRNEMDGDLDEKRAVAESAYRRLINDINDGQAWFFQIYGSKQDQTFHERQVNSGTFVNPLTARIGVSDDDMGNLPVQLSLLLDAVPDPVNGLPVNENYSKALRNAKRQIAVRTNARDVIALYNESLALLIRLRSFQHIQKALTIGHKEKIAPKTFDVDTIAYIRNELQQILPTVEFWEVLRKPRIENDIIRLGALEAKVHELETYKNGNTR